MADLTITATNVVAGTGATLERGAAGEAVAAGKVGYIHPDTGKWMLADSNGAVAEGKVPRGIFLNSASLDQPVEVLRHGPITIGATLTAGTAYYLSDTPGGICPVADVGAGENVVMLGLAASTTVLNVDIQAPGVTL
jgi:hypothetical protein